MTIYYKGPASCDAKLLKLKLLEPEAVNKPELTKTGIILENSLAMRWKKEGPYGEFNAGISAYVDGFPHQCGCAVVAGWSVYKASDENWTDYISWLHEVLASLGYTKAMTSLNDGDNEKAKYLKVHGWREIDTFKNRRTGSQCYILTKELDEVDKRG